jgi:hypothetical protein
LSQSDYISISLFEHRFWLQILGDHSRFFYHGLSSKEKSEIEKAQYFIQVFDHLLEYSRQSLSETELAKLNQEAYRNAHEIRSFKLHLLRRQLTEEITVSLSSSFFNHMVNEVEEYIRILQSLLAGKVPPPCHSLHHHLLWLFDAEFHAGSIQMRLDVTETDLLTKSKAFQERFTAFFVKAIELTGYLRANIINFPALSRFDKEVDIEMQLFQGFLQELEELKLNHELLGTLSALVADHMSREACYYLIKLAEVTDVKTPDCYPIKPRVQG